MTIEISAKCSDMFSATLANEWGKIVGEYDGYVPKFFPGEHFGDYICLKIDVETGRIVNWKKPTQAQLDQLFPAETEE